MRLSLFLFAFLFAIVTQAQVIAEDDTASQVFYASEIESDSLEQDSVLNYLNSGGFTRAVIIDGDTVPVTILPEVLLVPLPDFEDYSAKKKYYLLRRKVLRVYPYAVIASRKLIELEEELKTIKKKRKRRKHVKKIQKYMEEEFEEELKKLTRTEGQILCKLIYRNTDRTAYSIIKELRSGWTAFWWQATAKWFDISLKSEYHPDTVEEDALIENIIIRAQAAGLIEKDASHTKPNTLN